MPRPKPEIEPIPILLRLHPDTVTEIDKHRGDLPRNRWVSWLVNAWLADQLPPLSDAERCRIMRSLAQKTAPQPITPAKPAKAAQPRQKPTAPARKPRGFGMDGKPIY